MAIADEMLARPESPARFVEIAPENYLGCGGRRRRLVEAAAERWPVVCHGLCGDFSGALPIDEELMAELKSFLHGLGCHWYSDHLCLTCAEDNALHDLLPLPFTDEVIERASKRIREVQDRLELPIAVENISAYARMPGGTYEEPDFVRAVVEEADCKLLLDVNNVYVNSVNFGFDPKAYIDAMPLERVAQMHMAGHHEERPGLLIDTHGAPIIDPVYELYRYTEEKMLAAGVSAPVLLERDHHIPPLNELEAEVRKLTEIRGGVRD
jgi:uncharacterized protein (UPF0276 family)